VPNIIGSSQASQYQYDEGNYMNITAFMMHLDELMHSGTLLSNVCLFENILIEIHP
jgi:hypothetical protein